MGIGQRTERAEEHGLDLTGFQLFDRERSRCGEAGRLFLPGLRPRQGAEQAQPVPRFIARCGGDASPDPGVGADAHRVEAGIGRIPEQGRYLLPACPALEAVTVARAATAVGAGVGVIQVRERDLPDGQLAALVRRIAAATAGTTTRVIVNDRADIAIAAGAAGVHLRGDSPPASRVRAAFAEARAASAEASAPRARLIGRSVHSLAEADAAISDGGCDYLLFGTVFPSEGKPAGHPVAGLEALARVCVRSPLPVIAIGGITERNAALVRDAGAAGFAAVGFFMCLTPLPEVV